jgi:transcriptional regulator with XRE-family HTH domain
MVKKAAQATPNHQLRAAREERGWTQQQVADRIGAPHSLNISRWEGGIAFPRAHYVEQLCLLFEKTPGELGLLRDTSDMRSESVSQPLLSDPGTDLLVFALPLTSTPLWNVPYRRNPFFAGREDLLIFLHDHFTRERTAALTQSHALSGLGGIGKTQVAVEYAYRFREDYRGVFWVRAASREALIGDYVALAGLLDLPERHIQDQLLIVAAVKLLLARYKEWLLILDNADDLSLVSGFIPAGGGGHVLLTTRAQATGIVAPSIAVDKMDLDEGTQLLLRRSKLLPADALLEVADPVMRAQAQAIVLAMDGLPLALDQAGAYVEETGCNLSGYLELYRERRTDLLKRQSSVSPDYPYTVVSTWSLSLQ